MAGATGRTGRRAKPTGSLLGLDPSSRQRLIGLVGKAKIENPFIRMITT